MIPETIMCCEQSGAQATEMHPSLAITIFKICAAQEKS
jgi:hypothetical protein